MVVAGMVAEVVAEAGELVPRMATAVVVAAAARVKATGVTTVEVETVLAILLPEIWPPEQC